MATMIFRLLSPSRNLSAFTLAGHYRSFLLTRTRLQQTPATRCWFATAANKSGSHSGEPDVQYATVNERFNAKWNMMFERLKEYKDINGHCLVPLRYDGDRSPSLGLWVSNQRSQTSVDTKMSAERRKKLNSIGFVWTASNRKDPNKKIKDHRWDELFERLVDYKAEHGNCLVPARFKTSDDEALGYWVIRQRRRYAAGKLRDDRLMKLVSLGFSFRIDERIVTKMDEHWNKMFDRLVVYKQKHGDCLVPNGYTEDPSLRKWVIRVRADGPAILPTDRSEKLEAIGFVWEVGRDDTAWQSQFENLSRFREQHGHCIVAKADDDLFPGLYAWVAEQRRLENEVDENRRRLLNGIGFVWNLQNLRWEEMFGQLMEFQKIHGHCNVTFAGHGKLYRWVVAQRKKGNTMPVERKEKLDSIGFQWEAVQDDNAWLSKFENLCSFQKQYGHCNVTKAEDGHFPGIRGWVEELRRNQKNLCPTRRRLLDEIGFVWNPRDKRWADMFSQLKAFQNIHGHFDVTFTGHEKLYRWVMAQRKAGNTMPVERYKKLDSIGFKWKM